MRLTIFIRPPEQTTEQREWLAIIPQGPVTARGKTKEEARTLALQRTLLAIAGYIESGALSTQDAFPLEVHETEEPLPIEAIGEKALRECPGLMRYSPSDLTTNP
jgi:hypothetical protein